MTKLFIQLNMYQQQIEPKTHDPLIAEGLKNQIKVGFALAKWKKLAGKSKNRFYRLRELVTTQSDYRNDLLTIRDHIKKPLRDQELISENEERTMFGNIEAMIQLSSEMIGEFQIMFKKWDRHRTLIGSMMKKYSKFLLVYSEYFKNLNNTQNILRNLLKINPKAKQIQSKLGSEDRIVTIEDMMSKPFQRPLKYHLILRDYASKVPKEHPDYQALQQAIECYHEVNQKNNIALENKEKDQILMQLDNKFGNIIDKGARYYLAKFESILMDQIVDLYLFSNLLLIGHRNWIQPIRLYLDKWSYTQKPSDGHYFTNRVYVYGRKVCVHLSFLDKSLRDQFEDAISRVIADIKINQITREETINSRRWTNRFTRNSRDSMVERRDSFMNLKAQLKRPMVAQIIGNDQRSYEEDQLINYYVIKFHAISPRLNDVTPPHQIALVSQQSILQLQKVTNFLYPQFTFQPLTSGIKNISPSQISKTKDMRYQIQAIFIQLFLNSLFRNGTIAKRMDIYAHILGISDILWEDIVVPSRCQIKGCEICLDDTIYNKYDDYVNDQKKRLFVKNSSSHNKGFQGSTKVRFCDKKTLQMRQAVQEIPLRFLVDSPLEARLEWVKSRFGWINYGFSDARPKSTRLSTKVYFCNVTNLTEGIQVEFSVNERVRQIRSKIGERIRVNLQDYTIFAVVGTSTHILQQDQTLGKIITHPRLQQGFFSSFFTKEPYPISFWLRKMWFLETNLELDCNQRKLHLKIQELIFRIKFGQIKLKDLRHYSKVYAWYYCFKHFIELDTLTNYIIKKRTEELDKLLPEGMRKMIFDGLWEEIEAIKYNKNIQHQNQLAQSILQSVLTNPSGCSKFFRAELRPDKINVSIGCDLQSIKVRDGSNILFEFSYESKHLQLQINGYQLTVIDDKSYCFYSRDMWRLKRQTQMYRFYYQHFVAQNT